jgi:hypothetical protein
MIGIVERRWSTSLFASRRAVICLVLALFVACGFWAVSTWIETKHEQEKRVAMQAHAALVHFTILLEEAETKLTATAADDDVLTNFPSVLTKNLVSGVAPKLRAPLAEAIK